MRKDFNVTDFVLKYVDSAGGTVPRDQPVLGRG